MFALYACLEEQDRVVVVTTLDPRSARAATGDSEFPHAKRQPTPPRDAGGRGGDRGVPAVG